MWQSLRNNGIAFKTFNIVNEEFSVQVSDTWNIPKWPLSGKDWGETRLLTLVNLFKSDILDHETDIW